MKNKRIVSYFVPLSYIGLTLFHLPLPSFAHEAMTEPLSPFNL